MHHTGGNSNGHSIVIFEDGDEGVIHMSDIMPTHAHSYSLWILAFDDYTMTSIVKKENYNHLGIENDLLFIFYHDAYLRAAKLDTKGKVKEEVKRIRYEYK